MPTIKDSSSIEEVLQYIVACYGAAIYQEKQRLSNLIADLYTGEERLKRLYRRMVMEDTVSQQLYAISLKPIQERESFYNRLVFQFKEANFYEEAFARQVLDVFLHGMNLLLAEPISTKATEEDGEWYDEYGVKYSADRKKLIHVPWSYKYSDYSVLDGTIVICDSAFVWRDNLREITLPSSVTSIGNKTFWGCENLQEIILPLGVISIGNTAFSWCKNLREITLSSSVMSIGDEVFGFCENLQAINVTESNKFYSDVDGVLYTKNLKTIICYPAGKKNKNFVIPSGVMNIGNSAFLNCSNLQEVTLPSSVTSIGDDAFLNCNNLQEINLPSGVTNIGDLAFAGCGSLQEINIHSGVTSIGDGAFSSCKNLQQIYVTESNKVYRAIDGVLYTKDLKAIICYPQGKKDERFVILSGVTNIGEHAFSHCMNLREITLPSSVTNIKKAAFFDCMNLREITLSPGVTSIGDNAFSYCSNLREITIPSSVTCIGERAFWRCENLQQINIPTGTLEKFKELLPEWTDKLHEV